MSLVKFTCDMSGIIFSDVKISYNEAPIDSTGFSLVI